VTLSGLDPARKYFYSIGDLTETLAEGAEYFFITHPVPGPAKPTRIWAIGDCGTFNTGAGKQAAVRDAYYAHANNRHTDVWLALGDNAYFSGTDPEYQANFFNVYPALLRAPPRSGRRWAITKRIPHRERADSLPEHLLTADPGRRGRHSVGYGEVLFVRLR
jgi:hypothetical protein